MTRADWIAYRRFLATLPPTPERTGKIDAINAALDVLPEASAVWWTDPYEVCAADVYRMIEEEAV